MSEIIAVTGWRDHPDKEYVLFELRLAVRLFFAATPRDVHFRMGCAAGADEFVYEWCKQGGLSFHRYVADWERWGKLAGPIRNHDMLTGKEEGDQLADLLVGFPDRRQRLRSPGSGTLGCLAEAIALGIMTYTPKEVL